jgi:hypothetical protein
MGNGRKGEGKVPDCIDEDVSHMDRVHGYTVHKHILDMFGCDSRQSNKTIFKTISKGF